MAQLVQFTGIDKAVNAFVNRGAKSWSVWSGKQFLFSYTGTANSDAAIELQQTLESLDKTASGIYTLKVHEEIKKSEKIHEKTLCHGSFNFRLKEYNPEETNWYARFNQENQQLRAELETLKSELDDPVEDEEEKNLLGKIGQMFLEDPAKLPLIIQSIQSTLNMFTSQTKPTGQQMQPVAIGAINNDPLNEAIEKLKLKDPKLTIHMQKLALMAETDPEGFKYLLTILDNMK